MVDAKKIALELLEPRIRINLNIPMWLLLYIILLPLIAYGDSLLFNKHSFIKYIGISSIEIFLIYIGFYIAYHTKILEKINRD